MPQVISVISINVTHADTSALDALVASVPLTNRHALARLALRLGLRALAEQPARIPEWLKGQAVRVAAGG